MGYKILVADDSPAYLRMIEEIFKIVGDQYTLIFAENGLVACEKAISEGPDLILMDVLMPEMNGIQAIEVLRNDTRTSDIPIIVLSATESLQNAFEAGANDFITKPFRHYELQIRVKSALNLVEKIHKINEQNKQLEQQKKDFIDDITYSKRIQNAILPSYNLIKQLFPQHFILNLPRNIVSGDFYWAAEKNEKRLFAIADCTGHGISGAFMTMAGIAFLNEIVTKYNCDNANEILNLLREKVMNLLQQKGEIGEAADGMDIALCILDMKKRMLQYAGAYNPLYIVSEGNLSIIKADRMPIGIHQNFNLPFTNNCLEIKQNDVIYLFSDGYADQFGGPEGKKFRYKNFQDILQSVALRPLNEQYEILMTTFQDWKGKEEQIDDVMIAGIRII